LIPHPLPQRLVLRDEIEAERDRFRVRARGARRRAIEITGGDVGGRGGGHGSKEAAILPHRVGQILSQA